MINLKSEPKAKDADAAMYPEYEQPAYPYGLCLCLDSETLDKLGMKALPPVGTVFNIAAKVVVTSVREQQDADGSKSRGVDLQVTDMDPLKGSAMFDKSSMNP
jgi:hypothetical protein